MQPGYVQYPRPVKREMNFDCIPEAWRIFKLHPWKFIGLATLMLFGSFIVVGIVILPFLPEFLEDIRQNPDSIATLVSQLKVQLAYYAGIILTYALVGPIIASMIRVALKAARDQPVIGSDIWFGFTKVAGRSIALSFIIMLGVSVGSMLCYVPGLVFGGMMMFSFCYVVDKNFKITEAMSASWNELKPFWIMSGVLYLILSLLSTLGVFACIVGILVSLPFMYIAQACLYVQMAEPVQPPSMPLEMPRA